MRSLLICLFCSLLLVPLASAADLSGTWKGTVEFQDPDAPAGAGTAYAELKQAANTVTGTAGPDANEQYAIEAGKLDGKALTFEYSTITGAPSVYKVKLALVSDDRMVGEIVVESAAGSTFQGKLVLSRVK